MVNHATGRDTTPACGGLRSRGAARERPGAGPPDVRNPGGLRGQKTILRRDGPDRPEVAPDPVPTLRREPPLVRYRDAPGVHQRPPRHPVHHGWDERGPGETPELRRGHPAE